MTKDELKLQLNKIAIDYKENIESILSTSEASPEVCKLVEDVSKQNFYTISSLCDIILNLSK